MFICNHLETETQVIPVIVAPHGGGKSALANHLRRVITKNSTIITGTAGLTVNNLIKHISLSSKIDFTKSSDSSEYLLTSLVDQLMFSGKRVTVLIDQADALSLSCLAAIVYLASYQKNNKCLSIILFSQQSLLERLNSLISSNLHCVRIKSLPILPLNDAEVKLYTASCLKSIGLNLRSLPLDDNLISKIKRISNGLPINIQTLLAKEIVPNLNLEQPTPLASMLTGPRAISIFALILMIYCMHFYSSHSLNLIGNYTHYSDLAVHKLASFFA